ncbi:MAG TPA: trigger factor [Candidatus Paceibacterota bacterium]|nr:trigger factor [Candidatus Paceibacterota bacterium]
MPGKFSETAKKFAFKKLPDSEVELSGEVPYEEVAPYRDRALKHMVEHMELPGFRKGKVPADMALKKVGELGVLEEAVEMLMQDLYPALLAEHKVDAVSRPDIRINKLAPNNPIGLILNIAVYPEVKIPLTWKTIGDSVPLEPAQPATDEEIKQTLESLQQSRKIKNEDGTEVVPELTDEFAKSVGAFETLEALKEQIKKGIGEEKARAAKDKRRGAIVDKLLEKVEVEVPRIFVESEQGKFLSQLKEDIARFNIPYDDYLKRTGKTEEQLLEDFRDQAYKRAKLQLTLNKIADDEKVVADDASVEAEIKHALEHFPDAKPELLRIHIETVLKNEKVLRMLEGDPTPVIATPHDHSHE